MKRILTIIGARPQIIKAAAISRTLAQYFSNTIEEVLLHTGQHYDENMSGIFFKELGIPEPRINLGIGSLTHGQQTAAMLTGIEKELLKNEFDAIIIYGDTNSTIAGALAGSKLKVPVIHIEAGLRSFNKKMPEEINRIMTDHASTLLFSPTQTGIKNLSDEGIIHHPLSQDSDNPGVYHTGDVMFDNSMHYAKISEKRSDILSSMGLSRGEFVLCTIHRPVNTDDLENFEAILSALRHLAARGQRIVLPLHPRSKKAMNSMGDRFEHENISLMSAVSYLDMIALEKHSKLIITDSGGVQKEAFFFQKPCILLREETEWVELVENGNCHLCGAAPEKIISSFEQFEKGESLSYPPIFGDGKAALHICTIIHEYLT